MLAQGGDQAGIQDLAGFSEMTTLAQAPIEQPEQILHSIGLGELLAKQPDGGGVRRLIRR